MWPDIRHDEYTMQFQFCIKKRRRVSMQLIVNIVARRAKESRTLLPIKMV